MSNENNPHIVVIDLASLTADTTVPAMNLVKKSVIKSVKFMNGAGIAASDTDYALVNLKAGSTDVATLDTRAAGNGAVTANVAKAMTLVSGQETQAAGTDLKIVYDESGTMALTNAKLQIEYYPL
jgi:hypothetical protein